MNLRKRAYPLILLLGGLLLIACQPILPAESPITLLDTRNSNASNSESADADTASSEAMESATAEPAEEPSVRTVAQVMTAEAQGAASDTAQASGDSAGATESAAAIPTPADDGGQAESAAAASGPVPADFAVTLTAHNEVRAETGVAPLAWDAAIAQESQVWANTMAAQLTLQHDPSLSEGENISQQPIGATADQIVKDATFGWASDSEREIYAATNGCPLTGNTLGVCGHYRTIIDPKFTKLGCGMTTAGEWDFWVCRLR